MIILVVALLSASGTWLVGWWTVPVIALVASLIDRQRRAAGRIAVGAMLGWMILLAIDIVAGPFARLSSLLGGAMGIPWIAILVLTLLFPALLAWSAAAIGGSLRRS